MSEVPLCSAMLGFEPGDTTPCRMTGVTLHSHIRYYESDTGLYPQIEPSTLMVVACGLRVEG